MSSDVGRHRAAITIGERQHRTPALWRPYPRLQLQPALYRWTGIPTVSALLDAMRVA